MTTTVVILAAGQGTRMRTNRPKVLLPLGGMPMLYHCLDRAQRALGPEDGIRLVIGHGRPEVMASLNTLDLARRVQTIQQDAQLGSGHALHLALRSVRATDIIVVMYGDAPLIKPATIKRLIRSARDGATVWLTAVMEQPQGYGRILRDTKGRACAIIEEKDCDARQRRIKEVNTGFMAGRAGHLRSWLKQVLAAGAQNKQGEYLLTDVMQLAYTQGYQIATVPCTNRTEFLGANDMWQLAQLEKQLQQERVRALAQRGCYFLHPDTVCILGSDRSVRIGTNVQIGANTVFSGAVRLGHNVRIGSGCFIRDTFIGDDTQILEACHLDDARLGQQCTIGPFARIRPNSTIENEARVGNFVEIKNARLGTGSKTSHLSYVGDAQISAHVNLGAGTITCNYDGRVKHRTRIKDGAFIGSNTALVAPVTVGKRAVIGAGSVITKDVAADSLALARSPQRAIANYHQLKQSRLLTKTPKA